MFVIAGGIILALIFLAILASIKPSTILWLGTAVLAAISLGAHLSDTASMTDRLVTVGFAAFFALLAYAERARIRKVRAQFKTCPRCAEIVKAQAAVCKHCGHEFDNVDLRHSSPSQI